MKKIVIGASVLFILSCNSEEKKVEETKDKNEAGVQNVNGNMPDTTNAIDLNTHKTDSAVVKDSLKK